MAGRGREEESVASSPTWAVATVLTLLLAVSLLMERAIHHLSHWLKRTNRKPLHEALEKMKEELMLLGFMSLFLTATSRSFSRICIESKFASNKFTPCTRSELEKSEPEQGEGIVNQSGQARPPVVIERLLKGHHRFHCEEGKVPFTSYEVLEQLDRFTFVMAITHVTYSCLTMLLACLKIHTWKTWEDDAHGDEQVYLPESKTASTVWRQSTLMDYHARNAWSNNGLLLWMVCFIRQFGFTVGRADYLTLRKAFIMNHNLSWRYDFYSYMVRSVEDDFKTIVGVSVPLWGFVIAFMFFDINGSGLYFWAAVIPVILVLLVGTKLQHIIATLTLENAAISGCFTEARLRPRDELFWFKKPELVLTLIHFVLFQNAFELAYFFWFLWQFGYDSCIEINRWMVYTRLILGFAGLFLCSYSTLPQYVLVTQMGSKYKAALVPPKVREMVHEWGSSARRKRKTRVGSDDSVRSATSSSRLMEDHSYGSLHSFAKFGSWRAGSKRDSSPSKSKSSETGVSRSVSMSALI